ncbi:MAG: hypothetical protein F4109_05600 [Gammaproteobacteria bacterium]|nr:hypothetical protein [Gammaproteobacteria bacterium]MYD01141.1 hypothetical protein [Gammaproteobacteria bacterium]MYI24889.1 hypothetical protein [Gammaproteobacteria bacterium]
MIEWNKMKEEDVRVVQQIVQRAQEMRPEVDATVLGMDLNAAQITTPMDLQALLEADDYQFAHDVFGVHRHINRLTGEVEHFVPRFAISH